MRWRSRRHGLQQQNNGTQGQPAGQAEDAAHADPAVKQWRCNQGQREDQADRRTDHRHHFGAVFLARQVGGQGSDCCRNGPHALQHSTGDDPVHARRPGGNKAAQRKNQQADDDDLLAPP